MSNIKKQRRRKTKPKIGKRTVSSDFEYDVYLVLKDVLPTKYKLEYEVDKLPYVLEKNYIPDFTITRDDGTILYIEAKGLGRAFDGYVRAKMIAIKAQHPEKDIRIIFYRDGPIAKNAKMKASDWAEKHGFPYSISEIPEEWFSHE